MTKAGTYRLNGRDPSAQVIRNATDRPLELTMFDYDCGLLLVNKKTGDILFILFNMGQRTGASSCYLAEQVFLAQDGKKTAILLNNNHNEHKPPNDYIEKLQGREVELVEVIADSDLIFQNNRTTFGDLPVTFILDLNNPEVIIVKESNQQLPQTILTTVGNEQSTLPDIRAIERRYFELVPISKLIAWAMVEEISGRRNLIPQLPIITEEEHGEYLADAVQQTLKTEVPFSQNYLYKKDNISRILETLRLVEENNIGTPLLAFLVKNAAEQTRIRLDKKDIHITYHAEELVKYAIAVFNQQDEADKENFANIAGEQIARLYTELLEIKKDSNNPLPPLPQEFKPSAQMIGCKTQRLLGGNNNSSQSI